jgi:hypothetical protein
MNCSICGVQIEKPYDIEVNGHCLNCSKKLVHCVNTHAALVEAARAALSELERLCEETEAQRIGFPDLEVKNQLQAALAAEVEGYTVVKVYA